MMSYYLGLFCGLILLASCSSAPKTEVTHAERAKMYLELANGALVEGDPTGALQSLFQAEKEDATLPDIYHSKALAYMAKGDLGTATNEARKAVKFRPDYSKANNTLGKLLLDADKNQEALVYLQRAASDPLNREAYKAYTNMGIIHYRLANYGPARDAFEKAVKADAVASCISYYYLGHLDLKEAHFKQAIRNYERATQKICAGFADAHLAIGIAYERNKQYDMAKRKFLEIQQRYPNSNVADQAMNRLSYLP